MLNKSDYIYIVLGFFFVIYNLIFFDFRGVVLSVFFFLGIYLFYSHTEYFSTFHKIFTFTSLIIPIEIIIEWILFNGSQIGVDLTYLSTFDSYRDYATRFNPGNNNIAVKIGNFYRLDGVFGNHQLTGSYLAVSSAYFYGYITDRKYFYIFLINFIALIFTYSTISLFLLPSYL